MASFPKCVFFQNMHKKRLKTSITHANIASFASDTVLKTNAYEIGSGTTKIAFLKELRKEVKEATVLPSGGWYLSYERDRWNFIITQKDQEKIYCIP
ncbi:hypothetical protein NPIL_228791 [Nephila pilipes]|uniref:Uncharacterized protein n=1 Tax=Nephila pilipes TaxID=299642 RepID=A0A8X6P3A8_NEPPI|nr:hypothetical protein NPIL_228791 [Nephila pilipes]